MKIRWADMDDDWRQKEERAVAQREANATALRAGCPVPYPSSLGRQDPTKLSPTEVNDPEAILRRHREFRKICRPLQPKRYMI